jgi:hypothetical protein
MTPGDRDRPDDGDDGGILSWGDHDGPDADLAGLEMGEDQAEEIKRIFLVTLPQYLEPVEQMVDQLFAGSAGESGDGWQALSATLSSLAAAASRIGFEEIMVRLQRMGALVDRAGGGGAPADLRGQLLAELAGIRAIATTAAPEAAPKAGGQTVVAALRGVGGVDDTVLRRLTTAGLVTVDQLLMADTDEVVAVTGLDVAVVERVLDALSRRELPAPAGDAPAENVVEMQLGEEALRTQLGRKLHAQVELEAEIEELRAEVAQLRTRAAELNAQLEALAPERTELDRALGRAGEREAQAAAHLRALRGQREHLAGRLAAAQEGIGAQERRILELRRTQQKMVEEETRFDREVTGIVKRVERMLRTALREES